MARDRAERVVELLEVSEGSEVVADFAGVLCRRWNDESLAAAGAGDRARALSDVADARLADALESLVAWAVHKGLLAGGADARDRLSA